MGRPAGERRDLPHPAMTAAGLIMTGPTGTNVNDVAVALVG